MLYVRFVFLIFTHRDEMRGRMIPQRKERLIDHLMTIPAPVPSLDAGAEFNAFRFLCIDPFLREHVAEQEDGSNSGDIDGECQKVAASLWALARAKQTNHSPMQSKGKAKSEERLRTDALVCPAIQENHKRKTALPLIFLYGFIRRHATVASPVPRLPLASRLLCWIQRRRS